MKVDTYFSNLISAEGRRDIASGASSYIHILRQKESQDAVKMFSVSDKQLHAGADIISYDETATSSHNTRSPCNHKVKCMLCGRIRRARMHPRKRSQSPVFLGEEQVRNRLQRQVGYFPLIWQQYPLDPCCIILQGLVPI